MRRRIDMTEVETATKIRGKYLRALENEEWDLLPGPTFVKSFLRTYAEYLGLDARLLVEEYRQRYERPSTQDLTPFSARRAGRAAPRRRARLAAAGPVLVIADRARSCSSGSSGCSGTLGTGRRDAGRAVERGPGGRPTPTPDAAQKKREKRAPARARAGQAPARGDRPGLRLPGRRERRAGDRRGDPRGGHAHEDVHVQALPHELRQRQRADAGQRQVLRGGGERRPDRLRRSGPGSGRAVLSADARPDCSS